MTTDEPPIVLPALDGKDPLGFLAGLGTLRLLGHGWRLSWDPQTAHAVVAGPAISAAEVIELLSFRVEALPEDELVPSLPSRLVPGKQGTRGSDPARIGVDAFGRITAEAAALGASSWAAALWTDLSDDAKGRCARTPFNAPAGQQTLRSMFEQPEVAEDPAALIEEAINAWKRRSGFTGEGLDSKALRDTAEMQDKKDGGYGVPGATFLALHSIPFFRLSGNGILAGEDIKNRYKTRRETPGWFRVRVGRRRRDLFAWPLWSTGLDIPSVSVLLDHPAVGRAVSSLAVYRGFPSEGQLRSLGVWAIASAERRKNAAAKSDGFLTQHRTWRVR